jgi:hypothetical protein
MAVFPPLEPLLEYRERLGCTLDDGGMLRRYVRHCRQPSQVIAPNFAGRGTMACEKPASSNDASAQQTVELSSQAPASKG